MATAALSVKKLAPQIFRYLPAAGQSHQAGSSIRHRNRGEYQIWNFNIIFSVVKTRTVPHHRRYGHAIKGTEHMARRLNSKSFERNS